MNCDYELICNDYTVCPEKWGKQDEISTFHRIYYVYGGEAYCTCKNETVALKTGRLYLFPVMTPYTTWHNPADPLRVLWFHVETQEPLCDSIQEIPVEPGTILQQMLDILYSLTNRPEYFEDLVDQLGVFLHLLVKKMPMEAARTNERMREILQYVDDHAGAWDMNVDTLAAYIGMDRASFSRKFKKIFSLSPGQYIYAKRMNCAALALADGASVYQAACLAGYLDEKSFSRAFKRYMEISPSEYRKRRAILP